MLVHLRARVVVWLCTPTHFYRRNTVVCMHNYIFRRNNVHLFTYIPLHASNLYVHRRACRYASMQVETRMTTRLHTEDRLFTKSHKAPFSKRTASLFLLFCRRVLHELLFKHKITGFSEKGFAYCSVLSITLCFVRFCVPGN